MKILGLDLGIGSIGWALIETDDNYEPVALCGMGSRVINLSPDEKSSFATGKGESVCSKRTFMRTARKCLDRYQLRRKSLRMELQKLSMTDKDMPLLDLSTMDLWQLRADAATSGHKLTLNEIGRVLLMINQKRGYRHAKNDEADSTQRDYVAKINQRYAELKEQGLTAGQYFASKLMESEVRTSKGGKVYTFRIKENVLPRHAYKEEVEQILSVQSEFYPDILTDKAIKNLLDIIFFQRPLKSCKRLVSICEFETRVFRNSKGHEVKTGPKVAPRTSPLAQLTRIYETVNNIVLINRSNKRRNDNQPSIFDEFESESKDARLLNSEYKLDVEERQRVVAHLRKGEKLTETVLLKILGLKKADGFRWEGAPKNGLPGDATYLALKEAVGDISDSEETLLRFNLHTVKGKAVNAVSGELLPQLSMCSISEGMNPEPEYIDEPLYKLWHTVYSSSTLDELSKAMEKVFGITDQDVIGRLFKIDFVKPGYSNRSAKFMRRILPLLMEGSKYSEACEALGMSHSNSITAEENEERPLIDRLPNLKKGELRQPVIEKILNQMINVVNSIKEQHGEIDEIRVELARQLKQSKDQRAKATSDIASRERDNEKIAKTLTENGLRASRRNIQKYRLWQETGHQCMYCGRILSMHEYFSSGEGEIEHIIPRSIFFDDSISNKACSCRKCNKEKGQTTAYDYMQTKGEIEFNQYLTRIDQLLKDKKISRTKRDRLTTSKEAIPTDFLERDMRQTQYISKKAIELLKCTCRNVNASSGAVTDFFRHVWGYDMILQNLNIERYSKADRVEEIEIEHEGQKHIERRIKGWSKRLDHRHHAIDALVIALTRQGYIQRLNHLNTERPAMAMELGRSIDEYDKKVHLLEQWAKERPHFPVSLVAEITDRIAVSLKSGKRLTTPGKRSVYTNGRKRIVQDGLIIPRGSLHNETVYGKIKIVKTNVALKDILERPECIVNNRIKIAVKERLALFDGDIVKAKKSLMKIPLKAVVKGIETVVECADIFEEVYAVRKPLTSLTKPAIEHILDPKIRNVVKSRLAECGGNEKAFRQSIETNPIVMDEINGRIVKSVRIWSNDNMVAVRNNTGGDPVGFAMPGGNHHVAFYEYDGKIISIVTTFWTAVKRRNLGISPIVLNPEKEWALIEDMDDSNDLQEVAQGLPPLGSKYISSMKMGDMFVMGLSDDEINDAFRYQDLKTLTSHLYRVQKIANNDYCFRLHSWTSVDAKNDKEDIAMKAFLRIRSYEGLIKQNPIAVIIDNTGNIIRKND